MLPNGDIEFTNVVERVHMKNQLPDHDAVEYDSTKDKTPPPGFEDAARAVGVPLSVIRMSPQGKIGGAAQARRRGEAELFVVVLDASIARGVAAGRLAAIPELVRLFC